MEEELKTEALMYEAKWSTSLAVGGIEYIESVKTMLGLKARKREIVEMNEGFVIREESADYMPLFDAEKSHISSEIGGILDDT